MKVTTFTDTMIRKLKPEDKKYIRGEGNGFTIRVMPSGVKTWLYVYSIDGKRREMNLGGYPYVPLETARLKFEAAKRKVKNGNDPLAEKEAAVHARRTALTVSDLVKEYLEKHAVHKRSGAADKRLLDVEVIPIWGKRKAEDIRKRDVVLLLESIVERGAPAMSNQVLKITRKMFNFAVERDILPHSPFASVKALAPNNSRERTLSEAEIRTLWGSLDSAAISDEIRRALKLVLVTGQRPGEVAGMHTAEIDGQWWTIPAGRAKNGREHRVFLAATALELIAPLTSVDEETGEEVPKGYIFPCPHKKKIQPIDSHALPVAVRRNLEWPVHGPKGSPLFDKDGNQAKENRLGIDQFTPHDLRRTAATFIASMGFMDEIIDAVLNHKKHGIISTYNRHKYDAEKQQALEAWDRKLKSIITEKSAGKVIPILRAR
ncbi:tyrosine-type recombinase/integrase [Geomonas propionica]|uniref:Site-specific integrase n=1 Tax=Geomonas propionica TaxID=2798582 RepID=A0ABS0YP99_9BACT|nr:site-specific integrase [Geomonas propionica]MBJ6799325.1 site-specific integrase [Geomonas propionica]